MTVRWSNPVEVRFGRGASRGLLDELERPVLVVSGGETLRRAGLAETFEAATDVELAAPVTGLPKAAAVADLARQVVAAGVRTVLGVGGGSALDAARAAAVAAGHDPDPAATLDQLRDGEPLRRGVALVQLPTTAGTGSEVTRWASLWDAGSKWSVASPHGYADRAVVDPALTDTANARLTLGGGLDALTHACEALWGNGHNPISDLHAERALGLLGEHLEPAVGAAFAGGAEAVEADRRDGLSLASLHAGLAFSNTSTALAHALSYDFTGRHGLEHGLAVGLLLRGSLRFNAAVAPERVGRAAKALGHDELEDWEHWLDALFAAAGLPASLTGLGVPREAFDGAVTTALHGARLANNPGEPDADDLRAVLERVA